MSIPKKWLRHVPVTIGILLAVIIGVAVFFLKDKFQKPVQTKKMVQQVTIIQPPPPPPPPEVKPPEPEIKEEKIPEPEPEKEPEPAPEEAEQPPGEELGVDADGSAGADGFGLVGKKGGRGLLGGTGGSKILWYGGQVKKKLEEELYALLPEVARKASFVASINIWVGADGRVARAELVNVSGKQDVDEAIRKILPNLHFQLQNTPPESMRQPIKIKVTSRI
ncbi:MAG: TonB C-terminal domain-containing protein [Methylococcales bacterium]|nr:TonB-dependent receptor [Methylococcaceae bacterium]